MSFSPKLRQSESHYKLVRQVVQFICDNNALAFANVWSSLSPRDCDYFDRHFRRERRRNDPLNGVKKHRTAFSFFTQEHRPKITEQNANLPFGEVSKLVGQRWAALDVDSKEKYRALERADKERFETERRAIMSDISSRAETAAAAAPVATTTAVLTSAPAATQPGQVPKKGAAKKAVAAAALAAPVVAQAAAPAAKVASKKAVAAPVVAQAVVAAPVVAAAAPVAKKSGKKAAATASA
jgi:hypothetical protein